MRRFLTALLCACLVLSGCATASSSESQIVEPVSYQYPDEYVSLTDPEMAEGLEESVYTSLREVLNSEDFLIDEVEVAYVSQEYLDELQYNSQESVFFGYTLPDIRVRPTSLRWRTARPWLNRLRIMMTLGNGWL